MTYKYTWRDAGTEGGAGFPGEEFFPDFRRAKAALIVDLEIARDSWTADFPGCDEASALQCTIDIVRKWTPARHRSLTASGNAMLYVIEEVQS